MLLVGVEGPRDKRASGATFSPALMRVGETFRERSAASGRGVELVRVMTDAAKVEKLVGNATTTKATKAVTAATANAWAGQVGKGQSRLASVLAAAAARCPSQQIVLAGYSQGATAVHRSLASLSSTYGARLIGAVLIADGDRTRGTNASVVGAPAAPRRGRGVVTRLLGNTVDAPATSTGTPVISVCSKGDVVCDLRGNAGEQGGRRAPLATAPVPGRTPSPRPPPPCGPASPAGPARRCGPSPCRSACRSRQQLSTDVDPGEAGTVTWTHLGGLPAGRRLSPSGVLTGSVGRGGVVDRQLLGAEHQPGVAGTRPAPSS